MDKLLMSEWEDWGESQSIWTTYYYGVTLNKKIGPHEVGNWVHFLCLDLEFNVVKIKKEVNSLLEIYKIMDVELVSI